MFYFVKTPWWLQRIYRNCIWQIPTKEKIIYLTFDDGPHPVATSFVLEQLKAYNAGATFFCIGKNVVEYPQVYQEVINNHHAVGNHTFHHSNGWKTKDGKYMEDINMAKKYIDSGLFRPPYGKITMFQLKLLAKEKFRLTPVMWTVLSGDFDQSISKEKCLQNVIDKAANGSIVVFHDSEKAYSKLEYALPKVLQYFSEKGYRFEKIKI